MAFVDELFMNRFIIEFVSLQQRNFHLWRVYFAFNNRDDISRRLSLYLKSQQLLLHPKEWLRARNIRETSIPSTRIKVVLQ